VKFGRPDGIELAAFVDKTDLSAGTEFVFCTGFAIHLNVALNGYVQSVTCSLPAPPCSRTHTRTHRHTHKQTHTYWLHNVITSLTSVVKFRWNPFKSSEMLEYFKHQNRKLNVNSATISPGSNGSGFSYRNN